MRIHLGMIPHHKIWCFTPHKVTYPLKTDGWKMINFLSTWSLSRGYILYIHGCFLRWWYPQNTPKWSFLVGKPMVVGYHHFRKPPYRYIYIYIRYITSSLPCGFPSKLGVEPKDFLHVGSIALAPWELALQILEMTWVPRRNLLCHLKKTTTCET